MVHQGDTLHFSMHPGRSLAWRPITRSGTYHKGQAPLLPRTKRNGLARADLTLVALGNGPPIYLNGTAVALFGVLESPSVRPCMQSADGISV